MLSRCTPLALQGRQLRTRRAGRPQPFSGCPQAWRGAGGGGSSGASGTERREGRERSRDRDTQEYRRRDDGGRSASRSDRDASGASVAREPEPRFGSKAHERETPGSREAGRRGDGDGRVSRSSGGGGGSGSSGGGSREWRGREAGEARGRDRDRPAGPPSFRRGGGAPRREEPRRAQRDVYERRDEGTARDDDDNDHDDADAEYEDAEYEDDHDDGYGDDDDEERGGDRRRGWRRGAGSSSSAGSSGGPPLRDSLQGEALYGVFPVLAALRAKRRTVHGAYLLESLDLSRRKDAGLIRQVEALCAEAGVAVTRTSRHELNLMSRDRPHQGLVLDVSPLEWAHMDEFPSAEEAAAAAAAAGAGPPVWLALDEVVDPQNLGAVVRSAYCLGAAGVLACSRNCAPLSAVVSKASAGALEALPIHSCRNMPRTLLDARDTKGWAVLGAAAGTGSQPVGAVAVTQPTILVLGSEGFGLRTNVRRACSGLVRVEMAPAASASPSPSSLPPPSPSTLQQQHNPQQTQQATQQTRQALRGLVDSLNVSVATGILLHALLSSAAAGAAGGAEPAGEAAEGGTGAAPVDA